MMRVLHACVFACMHSMHACPHACTLHAPVVSQTCPNGYPRRSATGLSSLALLEAFPGASVTGVDLSPYFLAVGRYEQRERQVGGCLQ